MSTQNKMVKALFYIILSTAVALYVFPFILIILNSFKNNGEILENPFALPQTISFNQFVQVFEKMNFATTFTNSMIITISSLALILLFSSMCAYYLVRNSNKFNKTFFQSWLPR